MQHTRGVVHSIAHSRAVSSWEGQASNLHPLQRNSGMLFLLFPAHPAISLAAARLEAVDWSALSRSRHCGKDAARAHMTYQPSPTPRGNVRAGAHATCRINASGLRSPPWAFSFTASSSATGNESNAGERVPATGR
eukprot:6204421-Pleurochrysis_carterae.AAC.2